MRKLKTNLINYCISHEYINFLDSLDLNIVVSGAFKKKYPKHCLNDAY